MLRDIKKLFGAEHPIHTAPYIYKKMYKYVYAIENNEEIDIPYYDAMDMLMHVTAMEGGRKLGYDHSCLACRRELVKKFLTYMSYVGEEG